MTSVPKHLARIHYSFLYYIKISIWYSCKNSVFTSDNTPWITCSTLLLLSFITIYTEGEIHISPNNEDWFLNLGSTRKGRMEFFSLEASSERFKDHHSAVNHWQNLEALSKSSQLNSLISTVELGLQPVLVIKVSFGEVTCFLHGLRCGSLEFWWIQGLANWSNLEHLSQAMILNYA